MKALYHDGKFVKFLQETTIQPRPVTVEVLSVSEEEKPTILDTEVVTSEWVRVNGSHRKRWIKRSKTQQELASETERRLDKDERTAIKALLAKLDDKTATRAQLCRVVAKLVRSTV